MDGEELPAADQLDGDLFRAGPVHIWDERRQKTAHSGFHPESRIAAGLQEYLHVTTGNPRNLLAAFISHLMFEIVHPFYDGTGRTGRYLLGIHLAHTFSPATALTLSATIHSNKERYYQAFSTVEHPLNRADATPFLLVMREIFAEAQESLHHDLSARLFLFNDLQEKIADLTQNVPARWKKIHCDIMFLFGQVYLFSRDRALTIAEVSEYTSRSISQTRRDVALLREQGHLVAVTGRPLRLQLSPAGLALLELPAD